MKPGGSLLLRLVLLTTAAVAVVWLVAAAFTWRSALHEVEELLNHPPATASHMQEERADLAGEIAEHLLTPEGYYYNFTGCGNTLNCNSPVVRNMFLDCLRYWAAEYHIDGFRFDLASILGRAPSGAPLPNPPLLESLAFDPVLANCKLIAQAWNRDDPTLSNVSASRIGSERRWRPSGCTGAEGGRSSRILAEPALFAQVWAGRRPDAQRSGELDRPAPGGPARTP